MSRRRERELDTFLENKLLHEFQQNGEHRPPPDDLAPLYDREGASLCTSQHGADAWATVEEVSRIKGRIYDESEAGQFAKQERKAIAKAKRDEVNRIINAEHRKRMAPVWAKQKKEREAREAEANRKASEIKNRTRDILKQIGELEGMKESFMAQQLPANYTGLTFAGAIYAPALPAVVELRAHKPGRHWNLSDPYDRWEYDERCGVPEEKRLGKRRP